MIKQLAAIDACEDDEFTRAVVRTKAEFLEMPGLKLTTEQATRLFALDRALCRSVLTTLVESGFLIQSKDASFARNE
jgi:hypothetical protein